MSHARDELGHLVTRQLSAFARLGTLRHLDLELGRLGQIAGGHTEASRRHLLDLAVRLVWTRLVVPVRIFAAFAGVAAAADPVHADRQRPIGLWAQARPATSR